MFILRFSITEKLTFLKYLIIPFHPSLPMILQTIKGAYVNVKYIIVRENQVGITKVYNTDYITEVYILTTLPRYA